MSLVVPDNLRGAWECSREEAAQAAAGPNPGYVLAALAVAGAALRTAQSAEEALTWAINLGGDADTNGAVAGALLGASFGADALPEQWRTGLEGANELAGFGRALLLAAHTDPERDDGKEPDRARKKRPPRTPEEQLAAEIQLAESGVFSKARCCYRTPPSTTACG